MADECFWHPRLAALYDALDPDRGDLGADVRAAEELGARVRARSRESGIAQDR
ncbi:hypothetical protein EES44_02500 [Streptomyces sp. ADI96-15]|nr:Methyltransferase [Streptomyces sp. PVA_94-07]RPK73153.1 hypothetical protein EES44_02500 [Streptomyces sp. ADI96-15]